MTWRRIVPDSACESCEAPDSPFRPDADVHLCGPCYSAYCADEAARAPVPADDTTLARVAEAILGAIRRSLLSRADDCGMVFDKDGVGAHWSRLLSLSLPDGDDSAARAALAAARGEVLEGAARVAEAHKLGHCRHVDRVQDACDCKRLAASIRALGAGAATDRAADAKGETT